MHTFMGIGITFATLSCFEKCECETQKLKVARRLFIARSDKFFNTILPISSRPGTFLVLKLAIILLISLKQVKETSDWLQFAEFIAYIVDVTSFCTVLSIWGIVCNNIRLFQTVSNYSVIIKELGHFSRFSLNSFRNFPKMFRFILEIL